MERILNITNGDCAVDIMKKAGINGDFIPWRDVLYDGPVPRTAYYPQVLYPKCGFFKHLI